MLTAAFLLALVGVLCARDALSFLFFWELMTLVPAAIILVGTATESARHAVFTYVAITHLGGAGTWIALLLLAHEGAIGNSAALTDGSGVQAVIAVAAIIGFGTKAGLMPMHAWLPRAHPIAPAFISALMSGVMVAVAAYGLVRVLVDWLGPAPSWIGATVLVLGGLSALGGITYALFQRELKRLLAYSTVEHLGIVALGIGACLLLRRHGADEWAAFALGARAPPHGQPRGVQGTAVSRRRRVRACNRLRSSSIASEGFCGGCRGAAAPSSSARSRSRGCRCSTASRPNGLPSRRSSMCPLRGRRDGTLGAVGLAALAATMALAVLCFVKVIGLVLSARRAERPVPKPSSHRRPCASHWWRWPEPASFSAPFQGSCSHGSADLRRGPTAASSRRAPGSSCPVPATFPQSASSSSCAVSRDCSGSRGAAVAPPRARRGQVASRSSRRFSGRAPASASRSGSFSKPCCDRSGRSRRRTTGGVVHGVSYAGRVPHLIDTHLYRPVTSGALFARCMGPAAAER